MTHVTSSDAADMRTVYRMDLAYLVEHCEAMSRVHAVPWATTFMVDSNCEHILRHGLQHPVAQGMPVCRLAQLPAEDVKEGDAVIVFVSDLLAIRRAVAELAELQTEVSTELRRRRRTQVH